MRLLSVLTIILCAGCARSGDAPQSDHRWFTTYQTDRSCQDSHKLPPEDPFEKGPTGRTHPF